MIRPSVPGKIFFLVLALFYAASFTSQSSLLLLLIGLVLGCTLVNIGLAWRLLRNIEIAAPEVVHLAEGDRMTQPWKIKNRAKRPAGLFSIESGGQAILHVPGLPEQSTVSLVPTVRFLKRGVFAHQNVRLISSHPFGLVHVVRRMPMAGEVVVYPALYETPVVRAAGLDVMSGGKFKGRRRVAHGSHFAGVRPAASGDSLRQIHWKSSSKGRGLMVKTFEEELSGRVAFVLDPGHGGAPDILDNCIRATGSLLMTACDAGHQAEWTSLTANDRVVVAPFSDGHEILDRLARVELEPGCLTEEALRSAVDRLSQKTTLHLMLTSWHPAVETIATEWLERGRSVSVYLPIGTTIPQLPAVPVHFYAEHAIEEAA